MYTREDIIREIQKEAKENGGVPLSDKRFNEKTGITSYEWHRYWARFGDAQKEAGFAPNTFLKVPYTDEFLFDTFISLMREIQKWPTKGDLTVKHNKDRNFPTEHVFFKRIGLKPILAKKVLEYASNKKYNDIIKICNNVLKDYEKTDTSSTEPSNFRIGSVYLAKSGQYYKIGRTNSIGRRHHEISILLPDGFDLIHEIKTDDPSGIENYWHRRFEVKRKNGEWFDLSSSDIKAFKKWRKII